MVTAQIYVNVPFPNWRGGDIFGFCVASDNVRCTVETKINAFLYFVLNFMDKLAGEKNRQKIPVAPSFFAFEP